MTARAPISKRPRSFCLECLALVHATIYENGGKVYITKTCPDHGEFSGLYRGDCEQYLRALEYEHIGQKLDNPRTEVKKGCLYDCGMRVCARE